MKQVEQIKQLFEGKNIKIVSDYGWTKKTETGICVEVRETQRSSHIDFIMSNKVRVGLMLPAIIENNVCKGDAGVLGKIERTITLA